MNLGNGTIKEVRGAVPVPYSLRIEVMSHHHVLVLLLALFKSSINIFPHTKRQVSTLPLYFFGFNSALSPYLQSNHSSPPIVC